MLSSEGLLVQALQPMVIPNAAVLPVYHQEQEEGYAWRFADLTSTA